MKIAAQATVALGRRATVRWTPVIDNHLDDEVRLVEAARSAGLAAPLPSGPPTAESW